MLQRFLGSVNCHVVGSLESHVECSVEPSVLNVSLNCMSTGSAFHSMSQRNVAIKENEFLGTFVKLRKSTVSLFMSARPPARNNSDPTKTDFHEI